MILGVSLAVLATDPPARAFMMGFGGRGFGARGRFFAGRHAFPGPFLRAPVGPRPSFHPRRFGPFAVAVPVPIGIFGAWPPFYGYPPPFYGYPPVYAPPYDGSTYYPSQAAYDLPAAYAPPAVQSIPSPPPAPPMPDVVEYPTGRYQLRGDGTTAAYRWVWIPNPPPEPPPESGAANASAPPAQPKRSRLYRWTDDQGVVHLTNLWQAVPQRYRQQAKHPEPS